MLKIFTEAGKNIGLGHFSRCSSLMDEAVSRGIETCLIVYNAGQPSWFAGQNILSVNWLTEEYLRDFINTSDYCIVDSYLAGKNLYDIVSAKSKKAIFIDDTGRLDYPKGIIVNPAIKVDLSMYNFSNGNEYLLGSKYVILRSSFINRYRKHLNKEVKEVLITMGGTDIRGLIPAIAAGICAGYPGIIFNIVTGEKPDLGAADLGYKNIKMFYGASASEMSGLMLRSDFAITAAGQTIFELMATGTPFIPIKVIDNQGNNARGLKVINNEQIIIEHDDKRMMKKLKLEFDLMLKNKERDRFNKTYKNCIDGQGRVRIIDSIFEQ